MKPATAAAFAMVAAFVLLACSDDPVPVEAPIEAPGDPEVMRLTAADGIALEARLWHRTTDRIVVYAHEFRDDQTSWWPMASTAHSTPASALTFDFRGHGASDGVVDDIEGMLLDIEVVLRFVREQGYRRVMLAGAGMGAAVSVLAAAVHEDITVVGFSAPSEFDALTPVEMLLSRPEVGQRVWLLANRGDVSAAHSLEQFRYEAGLGTARTRLYPGRAHGVAMLSEADGEDEGAGADVQRRFDELLETFWVEPTGG